MPIQTYDLYTKNAFKGQKAYASEHSVNTSGKLEDAELDFGLGVKAGVKPKGIVAGSVSGNVFAISMREVNHEAKFRPSTGETFYKETETVSLMREGTINLLVTQRAAVSGDLANVVEATGEFTGGAAGAGESACINVTWLEDGLVGDIVKGRIDIVHA